MYTEIKCSVSHFNDSGLQDGLFNPSETQTTVNFSNMKEQVSNKFEIAASGSLTLTFGSLSAVKGLYILAENSFDVTLVIGLETITIPCKRSSTTVASENVPMFIPAAFDSVVVTNPSSTSILIGRFCFHGDP